MFRSILSVALVSCLCFSASVQAADNCAKLKVNKRDSYGETPFTQALSSKKVDLVKAMLACKPELNKKSNEGWYPLHTAAYYGPAEVVDLLVKSGADVNAIGNFDGWTPLQMAIGAHKDGIPMVKALLANGADKKIKSASGKTAYDMAKEDPELKELLPLLKP